MMQEPMVVLVDDDTGLLRSLRRLLREFSVVLLEDPRGLEDLWDRGQPGVVVCDQHLPGTTGIEVLTEVFVRSPDTTRILLTGAASLELALQALNSGAVNRFVSKPVDPVQLVNMLRDGLAQFQHRQQERRLLGWAAHCFADLASRALLCGGPAAHTWATRMSRCTTEVASTHGTVPGWEAEAACWVIAITHGVAGGWGTDPGRVEAALAATLDGLRLTPRWEAVTELVNRAMYGTPQRAPVPRALQAAVRAERFRASAPVEVALERVGADLDLSAVEVAALRRIHTPAATELPVDSLEEGMRVLGDIRTASGRLLVPEGTVLDAVAVAVLAREPGLGDQWIPVEAGT